MKHRTQCTSVNRNQPPSLLIDFDYKRGRAHFMKMNFNLQNYNFCSAAQLPTDLPKYRNHCRFYHFTGQGLLLYYHILLPQHPLRKQHVLRKRPDFHLEGPIRNGRVAQQSSRSQGRGEDRSHSKQAGVYRRRSIQSRLIYSPKRCFLRRERRQ